MAKLIVTDRAGVTRTIDAVPGASVMQNIRSAGIDDLLALCGGCLSCATCHVIVHPDDFAKVHAVSEEENDLLDSSEHRTVTSRLSCQIAFRPDLDGLRLTIADEG